MQGRWIISVPYITKIFFCLFDENILENYMDTVAALKKLSGSSTNRFSDGLLTEAAKPFKKIQAACFEHFEKVKTA